MLRKPNNTTSGDRVDTIATQLLDAACLLIAVRGVSVELTTCADTKLLVSATSLHADLSPCQLRQALATPMHAQQLAARLNAVGVSSGLMYLGGGLYQPSHPCDSTERWFTTSLSAEHARRHLGSEAAIDVDDRFEVVLRPDRALGRVAVGVAPTTSDAIPFVDEVALKVLSACLVEELLDDIEQQERGDH